MTAPNVVRAMLVALLFTGLQARAQSTVYRWVDKDKKRLAIPIEEAMKQVAQQQQQALRPAAAT